MRRDELRHLIRAACRVTDEQHVIVMGSQAILGSWKEIAAPDRVTMSNEADIAFFNDPEEMKADTVMGVLGLDSQFHETFGVYADGITADSRFSVRVGPNVSFRSSSRTLTSFSLAGVLTQQTCAYRRWLPVDRKTMSSSKRLSLRRWSIQIESRLLSAKRRCVKRCSQSRPVCLPHGEPDTGTSRVVSRSSAAAGMPYVISAPSARSTRHHRLSIHRAAVLVHVKDRADNYEVSARSIARLWSTRTYRRTPHCQRRSRPSLSHSAANRRTPVRSAVCWRESRCLRLYRSVRSLGHETLGRVTQARRPNVPPLRLLRCPGSAVRTGRGRSCRYRGVDASDRPESSIGEGWCASLSAPLP